LTAQGRKAGGCPHRGAGFSLIELIVVIVISGILAAVIGSFIGGPIQGFFDQARRGRLVDAAQLALLRMGRDLRGALPNSVRVSNGALELLLTLDGERYRVEPPGGPDDLLDFTASDLKFSTFAPLYPPSPLATPYTVIGSLAIYPLRQADADPYDASTNVMTASGTISIAPSAANPDEYTVTMPAAHRFPLDSPTHRVFLVSGPVSWLCDAGALVRYDGYAAQAAQPDSVAALSALGATRTVVAKDVQACQFQYSAGSLQRNAVAVISVVLADAARPEERVRLMRQVHVDNTP
jgi:MSHA biogenesis protein MshO